MEINLKSLFANSFQFYRQHFLFLTLLYFIAEIILLFSVIIGAIPPLVIGSTALKSQFAQLFSLWNALDQPEVDPAVVSSFMGACLSIVLNPLFLFSFLVFLLVVSYFSVAEGLIVMEGIRLTAAGEPKGFWKTLWAGIKKGWDGLWIAGLVLGVLLGIFILLVIVLVPLAIWYFMSMGSSVVQLVPLVLAAIAFFVFIGASLYISIIYSMAFPVFIFQGKKGWSAVKESVGLTRSHRLKIFGYFLVLLLMVLVIFVPLEMVGDIFSESNQPGLKLLSLPYSLLNAFVELVVTVFLWVFSIQLYLGLKAAKGDQPTSGA